MIGMVLVTHGAIGAEMLNALTVITGPQPQATSIGISPDDDMDACRDAILAAIREVNRGSGVVLLTDMFGGTPSNLAISSMPRAQAVVLAGVNLPMLVKLASCRAALPLLDAVREAESAGRKYIQLVAETIAPSSAA